jgi:hypothetical protein
MNLKRLLLLCVVLGMLWIAGCPGGGVGPTGPTYAPVLSTVTANPTRANPGAIIIFSIDFVDIPGDLNGGTAVINIQGSSYQETVQSLVSNATGTAGTLTTSVELSPLVPRGDLQFSIFVVDLAGNSSNIVFVTITIV